MKIIFKLFLVPAFWLFSPLVVGQVPASEDAESPVSTAPAGDLAEMEDLPFSALSDPSELSLIEGLDDPLERLRLRDQDTNMILDLIQMIILLLVMEINMFLMVREHHLFLLTILI